MNILQTALCNLKDELMTLGWFNRFYEYAELIERGQEKIPQAYIGNGSYKAIHDFDVNGTGYIRKAGQSSISKVYGIQLIACSDTNPLIDLSYPLRLVAAVPKSKLGDNAFSDDKLALDLITYIGKQQSAVTGMVSVLGEVTSYTTDRDIVWGQEVRGIDKQVRLDLSYIALDFTLTFRSNLLCFKEDCNY